MDCKDPGWLLVIVAGNNYSIFRSDRSSSKGGGICVLCKSLLSSKISVIETKLPSNINAEILAFDYYLSTSRFARFVCVYLPPLSALNVDTVQSLVVILQKLTLKSDFFLVGDFNFSCVDWNYPNRITKPSFLEFYNYLNSFNLFQLVDFSTHCHGNTLDLIITSCPKKIWNIIKREPLSSTCDHNMIEFCLNLKKSQNTTLRKKRNFYKGNYLKVNEYLSSVNWEYSEDLTTTDINLIYTNFLNEVHYTIENFIPFSTISKKPFLPKDIKCILKLKKLLYKSIKSDPEAKLLYKDLNKVYKEKISHFLFNSEEMLLSTGSKKSFYGYIKRRLKTRTTLPPFINNNRDVIVDSYEKADLLNTQFSSIYIQDNGKLPEISSSSIPPNLTPMNPIVINPSLVEKAISKLKNSVSITPDYIPALFLKQTSSSLSKPLSHLFNISLNHGKLPSLWKQAIITPIHKKGLRSSVANYRPISLTSVICRIFENVIHEQLSNFLMQNSLISANQYGFLKNRSTLSQHINLMDKLTYNFDKSHTSSIVYLDFSKAFDSVCHSKLIYILKMFKIDKKVLAWLTNYLSDRTQCTSVDGCMSGVSNVTSGVPQGSVLGPLLFILYLEDLLRRLNVFLNVSVFAFADDLKLLSTDPLELQQATYMVEYWCSQWQMKVQPLKSEQITFFRSSSSIFTQISINSSVIPQVSTVRDLGVVISNNFKCKSQIASVYGKTINLTWQILKSFSSRSPKFYVNLF